MKDNMQTFAIMASIVCALVPRTGFLQKNCEDIITNTSNNAKIHSV